jgi:hypothetical protein
MSILSCMALHLEGIDGLSVGRPIPILAGRPRTFKVVKHGHDAGEVTIEIHDGSCVVTNRSQRPVLLNGVEVHRAVLSHGDQVTIGKDLFRVVDDEVATTVHTANGQPDPASGYHPSPAPRQDSGLEVVEPAARHPHPPTPPAPLARQPEPESKPASDSDRIRRRRSISASMHSVVDQPKPTILNRVSSVFSTRARSDRTREEELQKERTHLLEEAGRQVLAGHALGLPDRVFSDLLDGRTVTIRPDEVPRAAIDRWHELTHRIALLDAEIAAVRRSLGMGPDLGAVRLTAPQARGVLKEREERVFSELDALATQELSGDEALPTDQPVVPRNAVTVSGRQRAASVSGRSRVSGRRRQA